MAVSSIGIDSRIGRAVDVYLNKHAGITDDATVNEQEGALHIKDDGTFNIDGKKYKIYAQNAEENMNGSYEVRAKRQWEWK